jgi:hypothetical protein
MSSLDDLFALLENTEVMQQVRKSLKEEPAHLLCDICREYQKSGQPVPDHRLRFIGYMGEAAVRALLSAGLVKRQSGGRVSLYTYEPTAVGLGQYEKLKVDGF